MAISGYPVVDCPFVLLGEHGGNTQGFFCGKDSASIDEGVECLQGVLGMHPNKSRSRLVITRFLHYLEQDDVFDIRVKYINLNDAISKTPS
ncbi:hypothetical protein DSO57_1007816 [Entomophthora muscae]|uniref:Uncharacterized protein n=1 Tax=Entomophthora muscae TaxID=34485 RepID=A0ACC2S9M7_9FUNG|nr:hypothetical protein DSO57_1007816 [Entomophthora muscae]